MTLISSPVDDAMITFSIIIPNLNSRLIDRVISALSKQMDVNGDCEIIVVGQDECGLVKESPIVRFIRTREPVWPAVARNIGLQIARGEVICFLDADCVPCQNWLSRIRKQFQDINIAVLGGGVDSTQNSFWPLCNHLSTFHEYLVSMPAGTRQELPSLNLVIRKWVLDQMGVFDEGRRMAEDSDLTTRLRRRGYTLHFDPEISVNHLPDRRTAASVFEHAWLHGYHSIKVDPRWKEFLRLPLPFRNQYLLFFMAPSIAMYVTVGIYLADRSIWKRWYMAPAIFLLKVVYCWGSAERLRITQRETHKQAIRP